MKSRKSKILLKPSQLWVIAGVILLLLLMFYPALAAPLSQASSVTVQMYQLNPNGSRTRFTCSTNDINYGCTAFPDDNSRAYPYGSDSSPSVALETDYLLDVVTQEMSPEVYDEAAALEAQAIVSRSFVNYYINNPPEEGEPADDPFNNSSKYQVFIPLRFEALNGQELPNNPSEPCASTNLNGQQQQVCAAVASGEYIASASPSGNQFAAKALFVADIFAQTADGTFDKPYLAAVDHPISVACDADNEAANQYGMSQQGANRWARGHQCSHDNALLAGNNPVGTPWSVKWTRSEQILFHYYTAVHLLSDSGERLSPTYRWNPLKITGLPSIVYRDQSVTINVQVQNTGVSDWDCKASLADSPVALNYYLRYRWLKAGHGSHLSSHSANLCDLQKGDSQTVTLTIADLPKWGDGAVTLSFDIYATTAPYPFWFSEQKKEWPPYSVSLCVDGPCWFEYFPLIRKDQAPPALQK